MTANLSTAIASAYDLSSILRVCVRSLEGDAPQQVGDEEATAHTVKLAGNMVGDLISTLELVGLEASARNRMRAKEQVPCSFWINGRQPNAPETH